MSTVARVDDFQRRHPGAGFPIAVIYKYTDDQGGNLAALLSYFGLLSLFPLLLLLSTVLGLVLSGDPHAQQQVLNSALGQFPVIGNELQSPKQISGGVAGIVIGALGALYGGLGVANALQNAMNVAWTVPRNDRPNPIKGRGRGLVLISVVGLAVIATTVLTAITGGAGSHSVGLRIVTGVGTFALNALAFGTVFRIATARPLTVRDVLPGAVTAAVLLWVLQTFGGTYINHVVRHASASNSLFAVVLGLIAFLYLASTAVLLSVEVNVVRVDRLHPRALLTPFTDRVELTEGDRRAYTDQAKAQRSKGFEEIGVGFNDPPT